ncbi:hypothetical protein [Streptomyces sp. EMB24]|uniref:hypothetical protein n=1 Tax=Streptomyces sp. EMB24 TaxID=2835531 RepID=UPI00227A9A68|nr:hypothetical protein [Streptomyces sp. EMB24]
MRTPPWPGASASDGPVAGLLADAANGRGGLPVVLGGLLVVLRGLLVVRGQPGIGKSALHPFRHTTLDRGLLER